jgi:allantoinase
MTLVLRGERVLIAGALRPAAIHVRAGKIVAVTAPDQLGAAARVVEAGALLLTPGLVDSHVHINEPGRTEWEGAWTATQAAAAGGITTVVDMPLNCIPATTSRRAAETKLAALRDQLHVDVAFWGGVVPGNEAELAGLAAFGVPGCKCFLCPSGVDEFPHVGAADLDQALPRLRDLGLTLLVHAEAPEPLAAAEAAVAAAGADPRAYASYLRARPDRAEVEAVAQIIALCRKHGARAHIVHLASAEALPLLAEAQAEGVAITAETCLHYLTFAAEEIPDGDTRFKCAPPIRGAANREALWQGLRDGTLGMVVSDHSPCTPALKRLEQGDFLGAWGGISGLQLGLSALWTGAKARGVGLAEALRWSSASTAQLAGLGHRKGAIAAGYDADLVLWDDTAAFAVAAEDLHHRHKPTPYAGRTLRGRVAQTWVGGKLAYDAARGFADRPVGSFLALAR